MPEPKQILIRFMQHLILLVGLKILITLLLLNGTSRIYIGIVYATVFLSLISMYFVALRNTAAQVNTVLLGGIWVVYTLFAVLVRNVGSVTFAGYVMVIALTMLLSTSVMIFTSVLSILVAILLFATQGVSLPLLMLPEWVDVMNYGVILAIIADVFYLLTNRRPAESNPPQTTQSAVQTQTSQTDIAESKAIVNLRETAEQLRIIFDEALDIFIVIDNDEKIVRVNAAVQPILGYTPNELVGRNFSSLLPSDNVNSITSDLGSNQTLFDALQFVRKDGSLCPMELTATIIPWENDAAILITLRDVSKHEELRRELEVSREKVQSQQDMMEARLNLIFMVAHQLRNPLAIILSSTEMLERYLERMDTNKRVEHIGKIKFQTLYLRQMMTDMLAARDAIDGKLQCVLSPLNLQAYCQDVFDTFVGIQPKDKHIFTLTFQLTATVALLDKILLSYMLDNLLTNAVKYSPDGGNVRVTVSEIDNQFVIAIADEGIGIPEEASDKLFDMFYRADNVSGIRGTGIGLGLAYMSAKAHGGTITYESIIGKGSTFYIRLPIVPVNTTLNLTG